jgi:phosphate transport system protein
MTDQPQELRVGYHRDLDAITSKVVKLFALVSEAVAAANEALLGDDQDALASVRAGEKTIDGLMVELEGDIERLLLLQAPVAEHIAKRAGSGLAAQLTPTARGQLERMGTLAAELWRAAADGFIDRDPGAGDALEAADDEIDDLHTALTSELLASGLPAGVAADATLVARFYERLGDHAVHIASRVAKAVR